MIWVKVYRMTKLGVASVHSCVGHMMVDRDMIHVQRNAVMLFAPQEPPEVIEVGFFFKKDRPTQHTTN